MECRQYKVRLNNLSEDIKSSGLSVEEINSLKISDFDFRHVPVENKEECAKIKQFVERHECLGKMSLYPTHRFACYYKDILSGVVIMDMPPCFSKLLGEETKKVERLISRGACISWSPKGLASWLIMKSINWMVENTQYRLFAGYSDPEAGELGTIYQACNFIYTGKSNGTKYMYADPSNSDRWFSDRSFRSRSAYKRYAKILDIPWEKSWSSGDSINWSNIPKEIENKLRAYQKHYQSICLKKVQPSKGKYIYIKSKDKRETRLLTSKLLELNPRIIKEYPKRF